MVPSQNIKTFVALNATATTVTTELTYGPRIDVAGAESATFLVHIEATNATGTHGLVAVQLEDSDVTGTTGFAAITGLTFTSTGVSAATSAGDVTVAASAPVAFFHTHLGGRKRYLRIGVRKHSSATNAVKVQALCILDNLAEAKSASNGAAISVIR